MTAALAVVWFAGWHAERLAYQRKLETQQNGAVEKQCVAPPSLGVAGEFDTINGQIGVPLYLNRLAKRLAKRVPVVLHHTAIGGGNIFGFLLFGYLQNE